jgi:hypothetical protein
MQCIVPIENTDDLEKFLKFLAEFRKPVTIIEHEIAPSAISEQGNHGISYRPDLIKATAERWL